MNIYIIFFLIAGITYYVQYSFQRKFKKYSRIPLNSQMTGKDVAIKMLHDNGISKHLRLAHRPLQPHQQDRKPQRERICKQ